MYSMTRDEIRALAEQARTDLKVARGKFRRLAVQSGYKGSHGGWISKGDGPAVVQGWQGLADLVARGSVRFVATEERAAQGQPAPAAPASKVKPLTPAMQRAMEFLGRHGYVDIVHTKVGTIVALMERGVLRGALSPANGFSAGRHYPATTPEQVWDAAHAEHLDECDRLARERDEREAAELEADGGWGQPDGMMGPTEAERATVQTVPIPARPAVGAVDSVGNQLHEGDPVDAGTPGQRYGVDYIDDDGSVWVYPLGVSMGKSLKISPEWIRKMTYDGSGKLVPLEPPAAAGVTGRAAEPGTRCSSPSTCLTPAVSTFLIDGRTFGSACERHIIEVHGLAEKSAKPDVYQRGTKTGRANLTHVPVGARILVQRKMDTPLMLADAKTGALIATVLGKRKGGGFRCYTLVTDLGEIVDSAARTMHVLQP